MNLNEFKTMIHLIKTNAIVNPHLIKKENNNSKIKDKNKFKMLLKFNSQYNKLRYINSTSQINR